MFLNLAILALFDPKFFFLKTAIKTLRRSRLGKGQTGGTNFSIFSMQIFKVRALRKLAYQSITCGTSKMSLQVHTSCTELFLGFQHLLASIVNE